MPAAKQQFSGQIDGGKHRQTEQRSEQHSREDDLGMSGFFADMMRTPSPSPGPNRPTRNSPTTVPITASPAAMRRPVKCSAWPTAASASKVAPMGSRRRGGTNPPAPGRSRAAQPSCWRSRKDRDDEPDDTPRSDPGPHQITSSGAIATIGTVWKNIRVWINCPPGQRPGGQNHCHRHSRNSAGEKADQRRCVVVHSEAARSIR